MTTGYLYHELFGWHDTGSYTGFLPPNPAQGLQPLQHFESPDTKRRLHELVVVSGLIDSLTRVQPRRATETELLAVHTQEHLDRLRAQSAQPRGGDAGDGISPFGSGGYDIALLSAGGVTACVEAVLDGVVENSYALVRPPGHHALPDQGMGFCLLSNLAIAARSVRASRGVERIAVLDWDVHHGNGTQAVFYDDPNTLTISVHQDRLFPPDSGYLHERGEGAGFGYSLNVPLPPGTGNGGYIETMRRIVIPALTAFRPDLILVASGFDANVADPLSRQMVTAAGYRTMAQLLLEAADGVCGGRVAMAHEGGYSPVYVPFCGLAVIEVMARISEPFSDPFDAIFGGAGQQELQPHQTALLDAVEPLLAQICP